MRAKFAKSVGKKARGRGVGILFLSKSRYAGRGGGGQCKARGKKTIVPKAV
jgi:hypothetical protein